MTVKTGTNFDGWTVLEITPKSIVIGHNDDRVILKLQGK